MNQNKQNFVTEVGSLVALWNSQNTMSDSEKLNGLAFSLLSMLDEHYRLIPKETGEQDIAGSLHELYSKKNWIKNEHARVN